MDAEAPAPRLLHSLGKQVLRLWTLRATSAWGPRDTTMRANADGEASDDLKKMPWFLIGFRSETAKVEAKRVLRQRKLLDESLPPGGR